MGSKPRGRPPRVIDTVSPHAELDRLLVEGELVINDEGKQVRVHPKACEIADRLGVSRSWVSKYAKQERCLERRKALEAQVAVRTQQKLVDRESTRLAFDTERTLTLCDKVLARYDELVGDRGINSFSAADLNVIVRLRKFLEGDADSRQEVTSSITLDTLQHAHRDMLKQMNEMSDAECGMDDDVPAQVRENPVTPSFEETDWGSEVNRKVDQADSGMNVREGAKSDIGEPPNPSNCP